MLDTITGEKLSQKQILHNEADSDSEISSDSNSFYISDVGSQEHRPERVSLDFDAAPKGVTSEVELAKLRVLEKQKEHIRTKYKA